MKRKIFIGLMMLISFGLGVIATSYVHTRLNKPLLQLCHKKAVSGEEIDKIRSDYIKIPNPFFENYYDGLDLLGSKFLYIKNDPNINIDYSCFTSEDIYPWFHQVYLESKEGEMHEVMCIK